MPGDAQICKSPEGAQSRLSRPYSAEDVLISVQNITFLLVEQLESAIWGIQHSMHLRARFMQAMREGSIQRLDSCLRDNQYGFIQAGTFLLVEKLKVFVHRRLFKRVALLHRVQDPAKADRLPLGEQP